MPARTSATADRILDIAERLVQSRGFGGFSYADVAKALGIRKASIHYHFPTKAALGRVLIRRYHRRFGEALAAIGDDGGGAAAKLERYVRLYGQVLRDNNRMCLCGMLAADSNTLPKPIRQELRAFFDENERWLAVVLAGGRADGSLAFEGSPEEQARLLVSALEGAMLVVRPYADAARFDGIARRLIEGLTTRRTSTRRRPARRRTA